MVAVVVWKVILGMVAVAGCFGGFAFLMYLARRSHTHKVGGRTYWDILRGRFPRVPRKGRAGGRRPRGRS